MFYLKHFYFILIKFYLRGIFFFLMTILLTSILTQGPKLKALFWESYGEDFYYPYFYILYDSLSSNEKIKLISNLPGVVKVKPLEKEIIQKSIKQIVGSLNILSTTKNTPLQNSFLNEEKGGVKIFLELSISEASIDLIKKYIEKVFKPSDVLFTPIKNYTLSSSINSPTLPKTLPNFLKLFSDKLIFSIIFAFWLLSFILIYLPLQKVSILVELYQRKKFVLSKSMAYGIVSIHLLLLSIALIKDTLWPLGTLLSLVFFLFLSLALGLIRGFEIHDKI